MIVNRNDFNVANNVSYGVGFQLMQNGCFDPEEINIVLQLLSTRRVNFGDGVVALDCGANVGVHTIEWAHAMTNWGAVLAFEAQERIFYMLAGNIAINNCFNARAIWAAVGAQAGEIGVPRPDYFRNASFGSLEIRKTDRTEYIGQAINYSSDELEKTRMLAIDDLCLDRLDFLKIDIEGMEMEALDGARLTIERAKPQIFIEHIKTNEAQLNQFLIDRAYRIYPFGNNTIAIHASDPVTINITS